MHLSFEPISDENREEALRLRIAREQEGFVETVAQCLKEARHCRRWRPVAIMDGHALVGFSMYGYFFWPYLPFGRLWLDRLLIDEAFQGRGYGKAALSGLVDRLSHEYRCSKIYLSVYPENLAAIRLYESYGFHFNGQKDVHGESVMVYEVPRPAAKRHGW